MEKEPSVSPGTPATPGATRTRKPESAVEAFLRLAWRTLGRFPLAILAGLLGMGAALRLNHLPRNLAEPREEAAGMMLACWLGVSFLFSLALFAEARRLPRWAGWLLQAAGAGLLWAYHASLAASPPPERMARFWLLMVASHLLASLAPALARGTTAAHFWRFNLRLLGRAFLSLLYSAALFLAATVALASVKNLFELPVPDASFLDPGIVILGAFFTGFFLSGVPVAGKVIGGAAAPANPDGSDPSGFAALAYPKQLRMAAAFLLMPLVAVYLLILYAYAVRVLAEWRWPMGWASYLVLGFCALGLLVLFVIHPLEDNAEAAAADGGWQARWEARWVRLFTRHFHHAVIPLLFLLFAAIGRRVHEYGLTENRYVVLALAVWLAGLALHGLLERRRDLRIMPASLCLISLLAAFGPWGAFEVSRKSQVSRLQGLLERNGMLVGGKLAKAPGPVPRLDRREIAGIAHYLEKRGRLDDLAPWLPSLDDSVRTHPVVWFGALDNTFSFLQALELPYVPAGGADAGGKGVAFRCRACDGPMKRVSGFDYLFVDYRAEGLPGEARELPAGEGEGFQGLQGLRFAFEPDSGLVRFTARLPATAEAEGRDTNLLDLDLGGYFRRLRDRYPDAYGLNLPEEEMALEGEEGRLRVRLRLRSLRGEMEDDTARLKDFAADVLVRVKGRRGRGRR
jgi:hypothetical protein